MYIEKIEIQYFRSIYRETISGLRALSILSGRNDVGKSNVLKALNLFFNNQTDPGVPFVFNENYNLKRLNEVRKESIKGKQYIQIKITFIRGNRSVKTLPRKFTVTKKWLRNDVLPSIVTDDLEKQLEAEGKKYNDRNKSSLTAYLNKIRYVYVPAIKDEKTFRSILTLLSETIYNDKLLGDERVLNSMKTLADRTAIAARELNEEFEVVTGIKTNLSSPKSVAELYRILDVDTRAGEDIISLDKRGDGIRVRFLPSILYYIAKNSPSCMHIWGFEEPENSLEYNLALKMAEDFESTYCRSSMIFITSHSPAFIGLNNVQTTEVYRCYKNGGMTKIIALQHAQREQQLAEELGYIKLQRELFLDYKCKKDELDRIKEQTKSITDELKNIKKAVLYTEGITDVLILKTAWTKLYGDAECPFLIKSCNVLNEEEGSAAGCGVLKELLVTTRPDCPQIVIGLFDNDKEGQKAYELNANFDDGKKGWKTHKNRRAHGLLLPVPPGKELFAKYKNLSIEFYFEKADIDMRVEGKGLELKPVKISQTFNGIDLETRTPTEMHFHQIEKDTKRFFAEKIVPSLPATSFVHFRQLFEKIGEILSDGVSV